ncbi:hypothetical protein A2Y83_01050 [Candidatus Falkowbacteria bacterium RBG_13_39_14]|uniref:Uncharacterized protein n=1 Tax=Candidatus Falkowbacteria bacterium RBG_13_39_14 TaxID=1797985 RepID=A0A1F5S7B4_9BACT|nr:MAG: hypothetical protein A2Y83_01050 [Candidatus Falkowbacteria bacterium RBG_13_39_14]
MGSEELVAKIKKISIMVPGDENKEVIIHERHGEIIVFSITIKELGWLGVYKVGEILLSHAMSPVEEVEVLDIGTEKFFLKVNGQKEEFIIR